MKVRKFPDALVIILAFFIAAGLLTYIIPSGQFERRYDEGAEREVVVTGSFSLVEKTPLSVIGFASALPKGIIAAAEIVVLIFLIGGALSVIDQSGGFRMGIEMLARFLNGRSEVALVALSIAFLLGGMVEGLYEEIVPLVPVLLIFSGRFGFNPVTTIAASLGSAVIGTTFSPVNPFGAVLAQKIAEVPFLTGAMFSLVVLGITFTIWLVMLVRYARKHRVPVAAPESLGSVAPRGTNRGGVVLTLLAAGVFLLIYGLLELNWGFNQMSGEFFFLGLIAGLVAGMGINGTIAAFISGLREMTYPSLLVGFAYGISEIMKDGMIIDTIVYALSVPLQYLAPALSAFGMMVAQSVLHIVVPSYTGQAAMTLPILVPLSDLVGLSRQACVLAFQYGAMLMDLVVPTSGALMAVLAIAKVSYNEWLTFLAVRMLVIYAIASASLAVAVWLGV